MTKLCLLLSVTFFISLQSHSQQYGNRDQIIRLCQNGYGGQIVFAGQIEKTVNGKKYVCQSKVKCNEKGNDGYIDISQDLKDACVEKSVLDRELAKTKEKLYLGDNVCGDCIKGGSKVEIGGGLMISGSNIPSKCAKKYRRFKSARDKYFTKGDGGGFPLISRKRQNRYRVRKKKLQECLFSYGGSQCLQVKSSSCFQNMPGISVNSGSEIVFNGGTTTTNCSVGGNCLSNTEIEAILADYYEDDCDECNERKETRRERRSGGGGNAAATIGAILNPLAYFGANYFGAKFQADAASAGAEACATAYGSYTDSYNNTNDLIGTENADVRAPGGLPLEAYRDPRVPRCNGNNMGSFAGIGGSTFGGNGFQGGLGYNPMFGQSYYGYGQGLSGQNPYGGIGGMFGLNVGLQTPTIYGGTNQWQMGGYYPQGGAGWGAGANGHLPYGGAYGGVGGQYGYGSPGGAYGVGGQYGGQFGGQYGAGAGVSQRSYTNPQGSFYQSQLQAQARTRDAQYYQRQAIGAGSGQFGGQFGAQYGGQFGGQFGGNPAFPNAPYATPPFAPYR